jgi:hypothetical protein
MIGALFGGSSEAIREAEYSVPKRLTVGLLLLGLAMAQRLH